MSPRSLLHAAGQGFVGQALPALRGGEGRLRLMSRAVGGAERPARPGPAESQPRKQSLEAMGAVAEGCVVAMAAVAGKACGDLAMLGCLETMR